MRDTIVTRLLEETVSLVLESLIRTACLLEATARKAGNVHPGKPFADLTYDDFRLSALAASKPLSRACQLGVGNAILTAVEATRAVVPKNTNLGIILLLAPLAAIPEEIPLATGIPEVLRTLKRSDADLAYRAIRLAQPGGMGRVDKEDLSQNPRGTLLEVMKLAADRDLIAEQYASNFATVLEVGVPYLLECEDFPKQWEGAIVGLQLLLLSKYPDSLIARKCGLETAREASRRANLVLTADQPGTDAAQHALQEFDTWLRADGNRRNPGTTADLVTAILFVALRDSAYGHRQWRGMEPHVIVDLVKLGRLGVDPLIPTLRI